MALVKSGSDETNSRIGENSYFSGRFFINGELKIDGKFEGKALQAEKLFVGPTGRIKTNITASIVHVEGVVIGNIIARNRVMLMPTARILGDITTPELYINKGVILEGRCLISNDMRNNAREFIDAEYDRDNLNGEKVFGTPRTKSG